MNIFCQIKISTVLCTILSELEALETNVNHIKRMEPYYLIWILSYFLNIAGNRKQADLRSKFTDYKPTKNVCSIVIL